LALAGAGALSLPSPAHAIDHVSLFVYPSALGAGQGWRMSAVVPAAELRTNIGVTLRRSIRNGASEEQHALRGMTQVPTVSFDGRRGRWNLRNQLGPVLTANMTIRAQGAARPRTEQFGCRGAFTEVPVALRGTFVLRTGTAFFGTIRRVRLRGLVIFNQQAPVTCGGAQAPASCMPSTHLQAATAGVSAGISASPDAGGWLNLSFREEVPSSSAVWYHVAMLRGFAPLTGKLPTLEVRVPGGLVVQGSGVFRAGASEPAQPLGACRVTATLGVFDGTFQTRFAGWGSRTLTMSNNAALYAEAR
jgi:hypothetical protein